MANNRLKHLSTAIIAADRKVLMALKSFIDYTPFKPSLKANAISELEAALSQAEADEFHAQNALKAARNARAIAGRNLHDAIVEAKLAVISQYGGNSDEVQALGLKKKDEYRRPARREA